MTDVDAQRVGTPLPPEHSRFGRPGGNRPKSGWQYPPGPALKREMFKHIEQYPEDVPKIVRMLFNIAKGNAPLDVKLKAGDIIAAAREIFDRLEDKPKQTIEAMSPESVQIVIKGVEVPP